MKRLKRQDIFLTLIFTMIFVFAFTSIGDAGIGPINFPPECDAGPDQIVECQGSTTTLSLDGTASSDPDGDPLSFSWTTGCPGGSFDDATSAMPNLTVDTSSAVVCINTLNIEDGNGGSCTDSAVVLVETK